MYFTYILKCADGTLYVGSTTDVERRVEEHNISKKGARYTRARRPVELLHAESFATLGESLSREHEIKRLSRAQKLALIAQK